MPSIIFYGAGQNARDNMERWYKTGLRPVAFADRDVNKHHTSFKTPGGEVEILPLVEAIIKYPDYMLYLTQQNMALRSVTEFLLSVGIQRSRINCCNGDDINNINVPWKDIYPQIYSGLSYIFSRLQDELSRAHFWGRVEYSITHVHTGMYRAMTLDIYMDWLSRKSIASRDMLGLNINLWQLLKENYPAQENDLYLLIIGNEYNKYMERFLSALSGLGIELSGCVMPYAEAEITEYMGIQRIEENEFLSKMNGNSRLILGLVYFNAGVIDRYSKIKNHIISFMDRTLPQYFEPDIFVPEENEIFVDVGAFDFENSIDFSKWAAKGYEKIYAFEPNPALYQECLEVINKLGEPFSKKTELINKGLGRRAGIEYFPVKYSGYDTCDNNNDEEKIEVSLVSLDEFLDGRPVTLVKMDVEGAEMDVLLGMENTIKRYKPKLAVCIYHEHKDLYEIMSYILSLVPEYKFYIRHYSSVELEEVLFCTV